MIKSVHRALQAPFRLLVTLGLVAALGQAARAGMIKEDDVNIGLDLAQNKLGVIWSGDDVALGELAGPIFGFGLDEPGLISLEIPFDGLVPLPDGVEIVLEVISFDPALKGWTPGFSSTFSNPGDTWSLGLTPVHSHPFWHIDSTDAGFNPMQTEWHATFRFVDANPNGYAASDPVTVVFTPEPATLALMAVGAACLVWRRRRVVR